MSKECRRDDSFVTTIAHCHGDAGEANGDGENGSWHQEPFSPSPLAQLSITSCKVILLK